MRTWRAYLTERFAADQEAAIRYLKFSLEEYQVDGDTPLLLLALRTVVESQGGISVLAKKTGIDPESLSDILSSDEAPRIDTLGTILNALGGRLLIEPIAGTDYRFEPKREEGTDVNPAVEKDVEQVIEPHLS
jgi:DNA-binding phage protein